MLDTLHKETLKDWAKPRKNIFLDRETPRRIRKIVEAHERDELAGGRTYAHLTKLIPNLKKRSTTFRSRESAQTKLERGMAAASKENPLR